MNVRNIICGMNSKNTLIKRPKNLFILTIILILVCEKKFFFFKQIEFLTNDLKELI